jgi:hypothetical protein
MVKKIPAYFVFFMVLSLFIGVGVKDYLPQFEETVTKGGEDEEGGTPLQDRMDLAMQQEFDLTHDPATNSIPTERLLVASDYAEQNHNDNFALDNQTRAAIPNVTWTERGPNNIGGRTRAIMVDPNDATKKTVWTAGAGGGLWKTTDITVASPAWVAVNNFFSNIAITAITYDPSNTQIMYFGTGEGNYNSDAIRGLGIWKSTNGGTTWTQLASTNNSTYYYIQKIVVYPGNSHVFAATRSGLYKSKDGGTTWTKVLGNGTSGGSSDRIADIGVAADGSVWASAGILSTDGVYRAPSSGLTTGDVGTWTKKNTGTNGFPTTGYCWISLGLAASNANTVYAIAEDAASGGLFNIYKTTDAGTTWTTMTKPAWHDQGACGTTNTDMTRGQAWYDLPIAVDPNSATTVYAGGVDLMKSTDGGTTWTQISNWAGSCFQYVHADQHIILFEPGSSANIYFGNDGGIYRTTTGTNATPTISSKNSGYDVTQYYACAIHPTAGSNYILAGAQDNGSHKLTTAGLGAASNATGGDGCFCHIDQDNGAYQWTSYVYNNYYRSINSGANWTSVSISSANGSFVNPTDYDNTGNIMYCCWDAGYYMRWTNPQSGNTTANVQVTAFGTGKITHVSCSQNTTGRVFFGLNNGKVVRIDNAGTVGSPAAGTLVGTPNASGSVSCIAFENGNDNHILVTYSNYGITSVYESTNALSATPTFTSVEGNLPDMPVRWALFNPLNNRQAMLATEVGVWSTDLINVASTVWGSTNTGLANVAVHMLQTRTSDNVVAAATHGRGVYSSSNAWTGSSLPVELLSFSGHAQKDHNSLSWSTASERNNNGFEVQRSDDGIHFSKIGFIHGAGNSTTILDYSYNDYSFPKELSYYRLVQTDNDGTATESRPISVTNPNTMKLTALTAYPNPFVSTFSIRFNRLPADAVTLTAYNMLGRVYSQTVTPESNEVTVDAALPAGAYIFRIESEGRSFLQRMVKE